MPAPLTPFSLALSVGKTLIRVKSTAAGNPVYFSAFFQMENLVFIKMDFVRGRHEERRGWSLNNGWTLYGVSAL